LVVDIIDQVCGYGAAFPERLAAFCEAPCGISGAPCGVL